MVIVDVYDWFYDVVRLEFFFKVMGLCIVGFGVLIGLCGDFVW